MERILRAEEVMERVPYSRRHLRRLIVAGKFPKPLGITGSGPGRPQWAWKESEIEEWLASAS